MPTGGYGIPAEQFKLLKDAAAKVLHSIYQQIWKTQKWPKAWKSVAPLSKLQHRTWENASVFIPIPKKGSTKECSNCHTIALISHASKVILKILQNRLQQYMNQEFSDEQAGFQRGRETRDQIANIHWIMEKAKEFQKLSTSTLLTSLKPLIHHFMADRRGNSRNSGWLYFSGLQNHCRWWL